MTSTGRRGAAVRAWILRNIVADDPHPVPSALDVLDHANPPKPLTTQATAAERAASGTRG